MTQTLCVFVIEDITEDEFIIRDIGHHYTVSVTNDADSVVEKLAPLLNGRRLLYIDSTGQKDEILYEGSTFLGFKILS